MKKLAFTLNFILLLHFGYSQNVEALNGFKYLFIPTVEYQAGDYNYGIATEIIKSFQEKGFGIISDNPQTKMTFQDVQNNPCIVLTCHIESFTNVMGSSVTLFFNNCYNQLVYKTKKGSDTWAMDVPGEFRNAVKKALEDFRNYSYIYNPKLTPEVTYPDVEKSNETEETIKAYLSSAKNLDPIEGIYKSYQSDNLAYYRIGIIKVGEKFKAIILESEATTWKQGEIKATFESSSMNGLYSVKWYSVNKTSSETFAQMENEAILTIEFKNQNTGEKTEEKFIKMFPSASGQISIGKGKLKATGSGFFITTDGIIGTNYHVVDGADSIEILVSNEIATFSYNAKVILSDEKNDVALLKINDKEFKGMTLIPYGVAEQTEIGATVFTIGFPLSDVMGNNYKVTNGIISANSGIGDDARYFQISVPLQPGNSGGPLFNKDGNLIGITSAKLNSQAVGTDIQNVNYAIKISYLINLYNMLPEHSKIISSGQLASKELQDQVKVLKNYVCLIQIF